MKQVHHGVTGAGLDTDLAAVSLRILFTTNVGGVRVEVWDHGQRCERLCCAGLWEAMPGTLRREDFARLSVGDDPGVGVKFGRWSGTGDW